ncbi:MAG: SGNH/GDSL hydrolase family protein [Metamycoplasmataceae bacterium]
MSIKPIDLSKDKIRYLAIGDSIAEGFNSAYGVGFPGERKQDSTSKKQDIRGMSYPAILAKMLNDVSPDCVEEFDNFCLTGTRISDWLYFLGVDPKNYNFKNSERQILDAKDYDRKENNPQKRRTYNQFGMFGIKNKSDFDKLKNKVKEANLISITIGANDWITRFPFLEIMSLKNELISMEEFENLMEEINQEIFARMKVFFDEIRRLNPTANIIVTTYPTTLPILARWNNEKMNKNSKNKVLVSDFIHVFNTKLIDAAKNAEMYYINLEDKKYWAENIDNLSSIFFDVHPTYFGYKKIAYELFPKISLSNEFYKKSFEEIKAIFPNLDKEYFESDHKTFANMVDFSKINLSDEKLIELSKITDEQAFWNDNSHEKEFLHLRRDLTIKKFFGSDSRSSSYENIKSLLKSLLQFINKNKLDPKKKLTKILKNKEYSATILNVIYESDYIDVMLNQVQKKIDENASKNIKTDLVEFDNILSSVLFDTSNIFFMLKDLSQKLTKLGSKELLELMEEALIEILTNVYNSPKFDQPIKAFLKKKAVEVISQRFNSTQRDKINLIVDNFLNKNLEYLFVNLIKSYFESLDKINDPKNINNFIRNFIRNFFKKIDMKLIIENIIGNESLEYFLAEISLNILAIKEYTVQDVLLFQKFIKLVIAKINNNELIASTFSAFVTSYVDNLNNQNKSGIIDFSWFSENDEFWDQLKQSKIEKLWTNSNDVFVLADVINLVFEKSSIEQSPLYLILLNVKNSKIKANSLSANLFNIAKDLLENVSKIEDLYLTASNTLYNSYLEFKKMNPTIAKEKNPYYKAYYRFVVVSLWVGYRLFQKDISLNIFWNTKKGIIKALPTISSQVHRLAMGNTKNKERAELVNNIFGEAYTNYLQGKDMDEKDYRKGILWTIQNSDLSYEPEKLNKERRLQVFKSLKLGYWDEN